MKSLPLVRLLYVLAAAYDGLLGLAFLAAGPALYAACRITPPNHWGYVDFGAGVLVVFGILFLQVAANPVRNRILIPYGMLLKACYVGTVAWHDLHGGIPGLWVAFAVADLVFLLLFAWSLGIIRGLGADEGAAPVPASTPASGPRTGP